MLKKEVSQSMVLTWAWDTVSKVTSFFMAASVAIFLIILPLRSVLLIKKSITRSKYRPDSSVGAGEFHLLPFTVTCLHKKN